MKYGEHHDEFLENFVRQYDQYEKLNIVCAGAGFTLSEIISVPGSSKVVSGIYLPYDVEETQEFITQNLGCTKSAKFAEKCVSKESSELLFEALKIKNAALNVRNIAVTAAIQTNRHRRGENQAFITIEKDHKLQTWNVKMSKVLEEEFSKQETIDTACKSMRRLNDIMITFVVIAITTGFVGLYGSWLERMKSDGTLTVV